MGECIFCEEEVDDDAQECPHCGQRPFSGMYFDETTYDKVDMMEKNGDFKKAWSILFEEWKQHTDHEYFDQEMAGRLHELLEALFQRHPELIEERIEMFLDEIRIQNCYGTVDFSDYEKGIFIVKNAVRPDLELKLLEDYKSLAYSSNIRDAPVDLESRIRDLQYLENDESNG